MPLHCEIMSPMKLINHNLRACVVRTLRIYAFSTFQVYVISNCSPHAAHSLPNLQLGPSILKG